MALSDTIHPVKERGLNAEDDSARSVAAEDSSELFEEIFRTHWAKILRLLSRLLADSDEAEDLTLEVFLRFYRKPPLLKQNPAGWLYRTAVHAGYNALRARKRRRHYEEQGGLLMMENSSPENPDRAAERVEEIEWVRQVLAKMKPRSAQILLLRHSGLSYSEVAEVLGVASASVGTLLARAEKEFLQEYRKRAGG